MTEGVWRQGYCKGLWVQWRHQHISQWGWMFQIPGEEEEVSCADAPDPLQVGLHQSFVFLMLPVSGNKFFSESKLPSKDQKVPLPTVQGSRCYLATTELSVPLRSERALTNVMRFLGGPFLASRLPFSSSKLTAIRISLLSAAA